MTGRLVFTLLGAGSSGGVPRIGGDWGVCDPEEPRNRRLRCSALIERFGADAAAPTRILIDTSPDMREQLLAHDVDHLDAVVISHDHADQTHGLDDLRALVLRHRRRMPVYMSAETAGTLTRKFAYCFEGSKGYPSILDHREGALEAGRPLTLEGAGGAVTLSPLDQDHGPIRSLGFRIGDLAYCNDVVDLPDDSLDQLAELDVFIVDALRYTPHPTHANLERALGWISALKPKRAILTNLHVDMDYATLVRELPEGVEPGYDGLQITLPYKGDP